MYLLGHMPVVKRHMTVCIKSLEECLCIVNTTFANNDNTCKIIILEAREIAQQLRALPGDLGWVLTPTQWLTSL